MLKHYSFQKPSSVDKRIEQRVHTAFRQEMDASKYRSRGNTMSSNRRLSYTLLLLLALVAGTLSVVVLQKTRERRTFAVLLLERDHRLVSLKIHLEKEKALNKEMKRKVEELKAKTSALKTQSTELNSKLMESEAATVNLKKTQKQLEVTLAEKESHINQLKEKAANSSPEQMAAIMEILQQKEAELEEIKTKFQDYKIADRKAINSKSIPSRSNNKNATSDTVLLKNSAKSSDVIPVSTEETNSSSSTATEINHQENISSEEQWMKLISMEDDGFQEKTSDVKENSDNAPGEGHSEKYEVPHGNKRLVDSRKVSQGGELDGTGGFGDSEDQASSHSRDSKLLEKEHSKVAVREIEKEINTIGDLEISKNTLSEDNQSKMQAAEDMVASPDEKHHTATNDETKQPNKRHKRRKFKSKKKKMADNAATSADGEVTKEREVATKANT